MFTGLIEEVGEIVGIAPVGDSLRLTVRGPTVTSDAGHGDSISVSGVCLTVIEQGEGTFTADVMAQSIDMSTLGELVAGSRVNLERAARVDSRLGGHVVQGHVDGTATLVEARPGDAWRVLRFALPERLAPLLVDKGSVTLSGVSLTISTISAPTVPADGHWFEVSLIPETLQATTLGGLVPGDRVNLETDVLARQVARMLAFAGASSFADPQTSQSTHPTEGGRL